MKNIIFSILFLSSLSVFGQETWNVCSQTVNVIPQPSYDSTFVLAAPSRAALAKGMASWTASSSSSASYLVYTALLTQSGTDAPVATVLENTLGGTVSYTRDASGVYNCVATGLLTVGKTVIIAPTFLGTTNAPYPDALNINYNSLTLNGFSFTTFIDGINETASDLSGNGNATKFPIEIRVYP